MRSSLIFLLLLFTCSISYSQDSLSIKNITAQYEAFEYVKVIQLSDIILQQKDSLTKDEVLNVLLMKAVSHYALSEEDKVRKSFIEILKTDREYVIDSEKISPKIVKIFNEVKDDFLVSVPEQLKKDEVKLQPPQINYSDVLYKYKEEKESIIRSFVFPGWGHLYSGKTLKGEIITSAAVINAGALIYFIIDSNNKRKTYLNETNQSLIQSKYSSYNSSYITRNMLITSLAIIYTYAQLDILIFNPAQLPDVNFNLTTSTEGLNLNLKYSF